MAKKTRVTKSADSESIDRDLAWSAQAKRRKGDRPTRDELAALRRIEKLDEEQDRWRYYGTIPKKHWREMSGRPNRILDDQAERWGIPLEGRTIDLAAVAKWLHNFLAENALALGKQGAKGRAIDELERLRRAHAVKAEIANKEKLGDLRHVDYVMETLRFIAAVYRRIEGQLTSEFGSRARDIIEAGIADADKVAVERYGRTLEQIEQEQQSTKSKGTTDGK